MADPASFFASVLGAIFRFWERSLVFFGAAACACLLLAVASLASIALGFRAVNPSWVVWFVFGAIVFGVATIARLVEDWKNASFHLIADDQNSSFHRAPRADGNPGSHTQLSLHFRATNNLRGPLLLSKAKLIRPRPWGAKVEMHLATFSAFAGNYDSQHFIHARSTTKATAQIVLHRDIGSKKRKLTAVLEISDQRGSRQRVKFKDLNSV
jgi:hypothetical protein